MGTGVEFIFLREFEKSQNYNGLASGTTALSARGGTTNRVVVGGPIQCRGRVAHTTRKLVELSVLDNNDRHARPAPRMAYGIVLKCTPSKFLQEDVDRLMKRYPHP